MNRPLLVEIKRKLNECYRNFNGNEEYKLILIKQKKDIEKILVELEKKSTSINTWIDLKNRQENSYNYELYSLCNEFELFYNNTEKTYDDIIKNENEIYSARGFLEKIKANLQKYNTNKPITTGSSSSVFDSAFCVFNFVFTLLFYFCLFKLIRNKVLSHKQKNKRYKRKKVVSKNKNNV